MKEPLGIVRIVLIAALLASATVNFVLTDNEVCQELRDHARYLRTVHAKAKPEYAPTRPCPEEYKSRLIRSEMNTNSAIQDLLLIYELIDQLKNSLDEEVQPKTCLSKSCPRKSRERRHREIGLTYAIFYKAGNLFRDNLYIPALVETVKLKLMRRELPGVNIIELFAIEDALLDGLADACDDDPRAALGLTQNASPRMVYRVHQRMRRLTDPNGPNNDWRSERATMDIVHRVLEHAYVRLQNSEVDQTVTGSETVTQV